VTGEYRNRSTVHGLDRYEGYGFSGTNQYTATLKSWVTLANAYWDIGCWKGITPYVGGGIGYAKNWVGDYTDVNVPNLGVSCANTHDEGNFRLGLACWCVLRRDAELTVDLDYRYLDIGDASSGKNHAYDGSGTGDGLEFDKHPFERHQARRALEIRLLRAPMPVALK
jgi:opacity protein-like surface antigen